VAVQHGGATVESPLVGRDRELERIEELVASRARGARFVVIRGEAGIGKTVLWRHALGRHREAGHRVLATRPTEEELHGAMVGLADLFGDGEAAEAALDPDLDRYERGRAVLATLRRQALAAPVVVAIDDVQWLDPPSAGALRYAFRRLLDERVLVLATERSGPGDTPDVQTIPADRREEIHVAPLTLVGTRGVLAGASLSVPRPMLQRIHELAGGNPMYAIELGRAVERLGESVLASVPPTLRQALAGRIDGVADDVLGVLRVAAALGPAPAEVIGRCARVGDVGPAIAEAVGRGVLVVGDDLVVRFAHPLLASLVLTGTDPVERRAVHGRIAALKPDVDARARHLALSRTEPDEAVAAELDEAARRAAHRGASALAADLAGHSVRLTPGDDAAGRVRRTMAAILHRAAAGDKTGALAQCESLLALMPPGRPRAEAITLRVVLDFVGGDEFLAQALDEVGQDELLRGRILELQGWMAIMYRGELRRGIDLSEQALALARRLRDPVLEMLAASSAGAGRLLLGDPRPALMERALELAALHTGPRLGRWPQGIHGRLCLWCGRLGDARQTLEALHAAFVRSGMEFQRPYRIFDLVELEIAAGNVALASELAADGIEAAVDAGNEQAMAWLCYPAGVASAHRGEVERAREAAATLRRNATERDGSTRLVMASHVLGLSALAEGQPARAVVEMGPGLAMARGAGLRLPSVAPVLPDSIEATALAGDAEACAALAAELQFDADAVGQPWVDAAAHRGRGLVALAEGSDGAPERLGEAAAAFDELGYRMDAARALLLQGRALRRAGRRNPSADVLADACARLEAMGATAWRSQAAADLERVAPGRGRAELTPMEQRVAELVVLGRRNREIADELFVSIATVEAHLTRIYRKLHVRSRTELARAMR
jgi:DNA-binding CsgD family transcriptional regulator